MNIISFSDFLLEGKRADAINNLTQKYQGNKEKALQDIQYIENQMLNVLQNKNLVNKLIYTVVHLVEDSVKTGHTYEDSIKTVLKDIKRYIDWEIKLKQQNMFKTVEQIDKMSWFDFNMYLNNFYELQAGGAWKNKYKTQVDTTNMSTGNYEIVHIKDAEQCRSYEGDKLTWCITRSNTAFNNYTENGEEFVFAFKSSYDSLGTYDEDLQRLQSGISNTDEFAVSALAIRIHEDEKVSVTCRYNHDLPKYVSNADNVYGNDTMNILNNLGINIEPILNKIKQRNIEFTNLIKHGDLNNEIILQKLSCIKLNNYTKILFENNTFNINALDYLKKYLDWNYIVEYIKLTHEILEMGKDYLDWEYITEHSELTPEFIERYKDYLDWEYITEHSELTPEFIERYKDKINWNIITQNIELTPENIEKYKDKLNWHVVTQNIDLSPENIEKYKDKLDWSYIIFNIHLTSEFIEKYKDKINFYKLLIHAALHKNSELENLVLSKYSDKLRSQ